MLETAPLEDVRRQLAVMQRNLRSLPAASRAQMDAESKIIGDRIARLIDARTGSVPAPGRVYATALRRGGIKVKPGRGDLQIVIGGATRSGIGRMTMRDLVAGAEFGAAGRWSTYPQRRRRAQATVTRRATLQFGRYVKGGRFIYPTWTEQAPRALEDWAAAVSRTLDTYWDNVAAHG